tara:strand:- start:4059 stop:5597 length:1539 start_codon:yes stop_codon:yes gene_type:complete
MQNSIFENMFEDNLDFKTTINFLKRRKNIFYLMLVVSLLSSFIYHKFKNPIFEGQFEIVLQDKSQGKGNLNRLLDLNIGNFDLDLGKQNLQTEVKILKSPSILLPIYEYVKDQKNQSGINVKKWKYKDWVKDSLDIKLQRGTTVLSINYVDTDKDLILPVLNKISYAYQNYSQEEKFTNIQRAISYLEVQLKKAQNDLKQSMEELYQFSMQSGISPYNKFLNPEIKKDNISRNISNSINSSKSNMNENENLNRYFGLYQKLEFLESELVEKSTFLRDDSKIIKNLKNKISKLEESLTRPQENLIKYRKITKNAEFNDFKVMTLVSQLNAMKLEAAKKLLPWELITEPTVDQDRIWPRKSRVYPIGLFLGIISSVLISSYLDFNSGVVYGLSKLQKAFKFPLLRSLKNSDQLRLNNFVKLIIQFSERYKSEQIVFITIGSISENSIKLLTQLKDKLKKESFIFSDDLTTYPKAKKIIIVESNSLTYDQLNSSCEEFNLNGIASFVGWIFLDNS